jgi:magnesium chelatase subunit I
LLDQVEGLAKIATKKTAPQTTDELLVTMEFILEALHQNSLVGKAFLEGKATFSDMMGSMLSGLGSLGDDDDEDYNDFDDLRPYR